jgi:hypothetical protein
MVSKKNEFREHIKSEYYWWFDLKNYDVVGDFSPQDWVDQIAWRRILYWNLKKNTVKNLPPPRIDELDEQYEMLTCAPYIDLGEIFEGRNIEKLFSLEPSYETLDPAMLEWTFISKLAGYEDLIEALDSGLTDDQFRLLSKYFQPPADISSEALNESLKELNTFHNELKQKEDWDNNWDEGSAIIDDDYRISILLRVDLSHSDAAILEDLASQLPSIRSKANAQGPTKKRRSPPYKSWQEARTLEYIDMLIMAEYYGYGPVDHRVACELLFPFGDRDDSSFFKTTKRNAETFLDRDGQKFMEKLGRYAAQSNGD